jgi:outer membrane cobalamin receptor
MDENLGSVHFRAGVKNFTSSALTLKMGVETYREGYMYRYNSDSSGRSFTNDVTDIISAAYVEGDVKLTSKFAFRAGVRSEYSLLTSSGNAVPRFSLSFKPGKLSQFSVACGMFYQQPQITYLQYNDKLDFEKAIHLLVNYQIQFGNRFFRAEVFDKEYSSLVSYTAASYGGYENLDNSGNGYSRGIDFFWKDNATLPMLDYWISYSFIDSKRKYRDYPAEVTPDYVAKHSAAFVLKYWMGFINTQASLTYNFSSGRPYNDPNSSSFMDKHTQPIHDVSGSLSYITNIFGYFTVVHLSVSNILGLENIYSYRYSATPNGSGIFESIPVKSPIQRTVIIGAFISIE